MSIKQSTCLEEEKHTKPPTPPISFQEPHVYAHTPLLKRLSTTLGPLICHSDWWLRLKGVYILKQTFILISGQKKCSLRQATVLDHVTSSYPAGCQSFDPIPITYCDGSCNKAKKCCQPVYNEAEIKVRCGGVGQLWSRIFMGKFMNLTRCECKNTKRLKTGLDGAGPDCQN